MALAKDWKEFLELLNSNHAEYVIVGAFAVAWHAVPRLTRDIDIWVRPTPENALRIERTLADFGFRTLEIKAADFLTPGLVIQLGNEPLRIDLLTKLSGVSADEIWAEKVAGTLGGVPVSFLGRDTLCRNKRAAGRPKDLADLDALGAL